MPRMEEWIILADRYLTTGQEKEEVDAMRVQPGPGAQFKAF